MSNAKGFTLLEALLASVILLIGVLTITQLTRGMVAGLSPGDGPLEHPEIVDQLLRDQVEFIRAQAGTPAAPGLVSALAVPPATYTVAATRTDTRNFVGAGGFTYTEATYSVNVNIQPSNALVGRAVFTKVTASNGGRVGL